MVLKLGNCKISKLPKKSTTWLFPFPRLDHSTWCTVLFISSRKELELLLSCRYMVGWETFWPGDWIWIRLRFIFFPFLIKLAMRICTYAFRISTYICIYMLNLHSVFGSFINMYAIFPHIRKYLYRPHAYTLWGFSMPFHVDMSLSMGINQSAYEKNEWPALVPTSPPRSSNCETHLLGGY